jgi:hypothetical protein
MQPQYIISVCKFSNINHQQILILHAKFHNCTIQIEHISSTIILSPQHASLKTNNELHQPGFQVITPVTKN